MRDKRFWRNFDWVIFGCAMLLCVIGLLVIYATSFKATSFAGASDVWHQLIFLIPALGSMFALARIDYRLWARYTPWLYGIAVGSLLIVQFFAQPILGAKRWIDLGFFQFQPSEITKIVIIIVMARFFSANYEKLHHPKYLLLSLAYLFVPVALVMRQPDLGTALVIIIIWFSMVMVSPVRKRYVAIMIGLGLAILPFAISMLKPFQQARLATFINPTADPLHTGYNAVQSTITVGSGQLFGRGLAAGSQTQLNFLPSLAQHTDFIFAVLAEKMGFIGGALLLIVFGTLLLRGLQIAARSQDRFGLFMATGVVAMLTFHFFINIGMNMGIAPVTGIPLPFVSYGGTSLIVAFASVGLLESIAVRRKKLQFEG
jgi:rod shape determining protein RodA